MLNPGAVSEETIAGVKALIQVITTIACSVSYNLTISSTLL